MIENVLFFFVYKVFKLHISREIYGNLVQFVKFGFVGVLNNLISYVIYLILIKSGMHYTPANIIGFSVSVLNSYFWNNKYVFTSEGKRVWWKSLLKTYISYATTGIILGNILLGLWIEVCGISKNIAPLINLVVTIPINFLINKFCAYRK